jgi:hypothetical protein
MMLRYEPHCLGPGNKNHSPPVFPNLPTSPAGQCLTPCFRYLYTDELDLSSSTQGPLPTLQSCWRIAHEWSLEATKKVLEKTIAGLVDYSNIADVLTWRGKTVFSAHLSSVGTSFLVTMVMVRYHLSVHMLKSTITRSLVAYLT